MLSFDQYPSEEEAYKEILLQGLKGHEEAVMTIFLKEGPEALKKKLRLVRDSDWNQIFDYLVFECDLLRACILQFEHFFKQLVLEKGPLSIRTVLGIENKMYDKVFEQLFDLIAISKGALFDFVKSHQEALLEQIRKGQGTTLRTSLGLANRKYDSTWEEILGLLYRNFGQQLIDDRIVEQGLNSFVLLMNYLRVHRSLS